MREAQPNPAHLALAELERRGLVEAVVTQNVDRLHAAAGSKQVIEVHGSIRTASCLACGRREEFERVRRAAARARLRALRRRPEAGRGHVRRADAGGRSSTGRSSSCAEPALLLVVGSSLEVYPVAGIPEDALAAGAKLAIVNRGATPYDRRAELKIDAAAGETLSAGRPHAAARLSGCSSSSRPQVEQTTRATSNGTPPRWAIACEVTAWWRCGSVPAGRLDPSGFLTTIEE